MPVYVDAYAYTGIFNIQVTEKAWPATAGLENDVLAPFEVLERSSNYVIYEDENGQERNDWTN